LTRWQEESDPELEALQALIFGAGQLWLVRVDDKDSKDIRQLRTGVNGNILGGA
jgi:hypothetical protein